MKGASMILMVLFLVLTVPLMATPIQGNTGIDFSTTCNIEIFSLNHMIEEVNINQAVSAPVCIEAICLLLDDRRKLIPLLEFSESESSRDNNSSMITSGKSYIKQRRIKSGRH